MRESVAEDLRHAQLLPHPFDDAGREELLAKGFAVAHGRPGLDKAERAGVADDVEEIVHRFLGLFRSSSHRTGFCSM